MFYCLLRVIFYGKMRYLFEKFNFEQRCFKGVCIEFKGWIKIGFYSVLKPNKEF